MNASAVELAMVMAFDKQGKLVFAVKGEVIMVPREEVVVEIFGWEIAGWVVGVGAVDIVGGRLGVEIVGGVVVDEEIEAFGVVDDDEEIDVEVKLEVDIVNVEVFGPNIPCTSETRACSSLVDVVVVDATIGTGAAVPVSGCSSFCVMCVTGDAAATGVVSFCATTVVVTGSRASSVTWVAAERDSMGMVAFC